MLAMALVVISRSQVPGPPFRQSWWVPATQTGGQFAKKLGQFGSIEILSDDKVVLALDLAVGKTVWKRTTAGGVIVEIPSPPGSFYYATFDLRRGKKGTLVHIDPASGKTLNYMPLDFHGGGLVDDGSFYFLDGKGRFDSLKLSTN